MKAFCPVVLLLLLPIVGLCQEAKDGFIIINNGQFKYGTIQIDNSETQYTECLFKEASKSEYKKYSPGQIEGYGVINGNKFVTREIDIESQQKKVFLKTDFEGLIKQYSYRNKIFVEESSLTELHQDTFSKSLAELLKSCKNVGGVIARTDFDVKSITSLLERYEQCSKDNFILPKKVNVHFEGLAGVELNSTSLTSSIPSLRFANAAALTDKTLLSVGLRAQVSLLQIKALAFCTGLYYYQQQFYLISTSGTNPVQTDKLNLDFNEFVVPLNFQYTFTDETKPVQPYMRSGISIPFVTNSSLQVEHVEESSNVVYIDAYDVMKSFKQSIQLDVAGGLNFAVSKKLRSFVEVHYNMGKGEIKTTLSNTETISSKSSRLNIMVGLRF